MKGFTLLETMVAISILLTAIGGPFVVTQVGIRTARKASQELVAANLAQEGIEFMHYMRDTNSFKSQPWLTGLTGTKDCIGEMGNGPKSCVIDSVLNEIHDYNHPSLGCSTHEDMSTCPFVQYNDETGFYGYGYGDGYDTIYRRAVHTEVVRELDDEPVEIRVVSEVAWSDLGVPRSIRLEEYLTDWR
jgi:prepilin-type N-terminal cleavage/methylation domain-containing protein